MVELESHLDCANSSRGWCAPALVSTTVGWLLKEYNRYGTCQNSEGIGVSVGGERERETTTLQNSNVWLLPFTHSLVLPFTFI